MADQNTSDVVTAGEKLDSSCGNSGGHSASLPASRPIPEIESGCHELKVKDERHDWRVVYAVESDAIVILEVFGKGSKRTPKHVKETCRRRVREYRRLTQEEV